MAVIAGLPGTASGRLPDHARLSLRGLGPVHIGMTVRTAARRLGQRLKVTRFNPPCGSATLSRRLGVFALTTGRRIERIDVTERGVRNARGIGIGDRMGKVKRRYPRVRRYRAAYTNFPAYRYRRGNRLLLFVSDGHRHVASMSTGRRPEINYIEGCA